MNRTIGPLWLTSLLAVATLEGCSAKLTTETSAADEATVRQTLARMEQRINQGDLGFVDVFAKDAVIIAPSVPDIAGSEAIRAMYAGLTWRG
jgi:ketosteroid isomerase-like protein